MPYLFCLIVDVVIVSCIACLGWFVWKGASACLIFAMLLLVLALVLPGRDIFTCPKCGHVAEVKVYKGLSNMTAGVQKDKGDPDD